MCNRHRKCVKLIIIIYHTYYTAVVAVQHHPHIKIIICISNIYYIIYIFIDVWNTILHSAITEYQHSQRHKLDSKSIRMHTVTISKLGI